MCAEKLTSTAVGRFAERTRMHGDAVQWSVGRSDLPRRSWVRCVGLASRVEVEVVVRV